MNEIDKHNQWKSVLMFDYDYHNRLWSTSLYLYLVMLIRFRYMYNIFSQYKQLRNEKNAHVKHFELTWFVFISRNSNPVHCWGVLTSVMSSLTAAKSSSHLSVQRATCMSRSPNSRVVAALSSHRHWSILLSSKLRQLCSQVNIFTDFSLNYRQKQGFLENISIGSPTLMLIVILKRIQLRLRIWN